ncbi:MAG: hypothetical protein Q4G36_08400 [Paracoccus sp. (in: a-proteobacteria)]|nr:hypothetical protein [Paracoccus sp. (in: a-proteobacteria)]
MTERQHIANAAAALDDPTVTRFAGTEIRIVEDGHKIRDPRTGDLHEVSKGTVVFTDAGRRLYCVQSDFDLMKAEAEKALPSRFGGAKG